MTAAAVDPVAAVDIWPTCRRLRAALRANTVFSLGSGLVLAAGGAFVAQPWGLGPASHREQLPHKHTHPGRRQRGAVAGGDLCTACRMIRGLTLPTEIARCDGCGHR